MAEPFKNELGEKRIQVIAQHFSKHSKRFDKEQFLSLALNELEDLSLMQRNQQIVAALGETLNKDFVQAKKHILKTLAPEDQQIDEKGLHSWLSIPLAEYVGQFGQDHFSEAMDAMSKITPFFSCEWAIRHFLLNQQSTTLEQLHEWCDHPHEHVRRLVTEGSRPRLPWGFQLPEFIQNPKHTFPLLEKLKNDESDYVRLSVSNHLNDISKDHPDWLQQKLESWIDLEDTNRMKLIRHACRTLIKQGHAATLKMLGYNSFKTKDVELNLHTPKLKYGNSLQFDLQFSGPKNKPVIVDFIIHFQKAGGSLAPKVFKWKTTQLNKQGQFNFKKSHAIKPITTRKYYNGPHKLEIQVNGNSLITKDFELYGV